MKEIHFRANQFRTFLSWNPLNKTKIEWRNCFRVRNWADKTASLSSKKLNEKGHLQWKINYLELQFGTYNLIFCLRTVWKHSELDGPGFCTERDQAELTKRFYLSTNLCFLTERFLSLSQSNLREIFTEDGLTRSCAQKSAFSLH